MGLENPNPANPAKLFGITPIKPIPLDHRLFIVKMDQWIKTMANLGRLRCLTSDVLEWSVDPLASNPDSQLGPCVMVHEGIKPQAQNI